MSERKPPRDHENEEIIKAFDRARSEAHDLSRQQEEEIRNARDRDRQVLIERRRHPR